MRLLRRTHILDHGPVVIHRVRGRDADSTEVGIVELQGQSPQDVVATLTEGRLLTIQNLRAGVSHWKHPFVR